MLTFYTWTMMKEEEKHDYLWENQNSNWFDER